MLSRTPLHETIDRTTLEPWRRALLDGADYIARNGHHKGACYNYAAGPNPPSCLIGSLSNAGGINNILEPVEIFEKYINGYNVVAWNDAPERTAGEVIAAMRACALEDLL